MCHDMNEWKLSGSPLRLIQYVQCWNFIVNSFKTLYNTVTVLVSLCKNYHSNVFFSWTTHIIINVHIDIAKKRTNKAKKKQQKFIWETQLGHYRTTNALSSINKHIILFYYCIYVYLILLFFFWRLKCHGRTRISFGLCVCGCVVIHSSTHSRKVKFLIILQKKHTKIKENFDKTRAL